jgi:hypothetical protein
MLETINSRGIVDYRWVSPSPSELHGESHRIIQQSSAIDNSYS